MITRLINTLGLATYKQIQTERKAIEDILTFHANQKTFLEHKFKELEQSIEFINNDDHEEEIEMLTNRVDTLEEELDGVLTKSNFDVDDHFDIDNYQGEIDTMINNEIAYSHSDLVTSEAVDEAIKEALEEFKEANYEDPDVSMEQICSSAIEQIGAAILGLTHEEPEATPESTEYIDPVLKEIISNDPLLKLLDED